jgi:hypothetical protein
MVMNKLLLYLLLLLLPVKGLSFVVVKDGQFYADGKPWRAVGVILMGDVNDKHVFHDVARFGWNSVRVAPRSVKQLSLFVKWAKREGLKLCVVVADDSWQTKELSSFRKKKEIWAWEVTSVPMAERVKTACPNHLVSLGSDPLLVNLQRYADDALFCRHVDFLSVALLPIERQWVAPTNLYFGLKHAFLKTTMLLNELGRMAKQLNKPMVVTSCAYPRNKMFRFEGSETNNREAYFATVQSFMNQQSDSDVKIAACFFSQWRLNDSAMTNEMPQPDASYSIYPSDNNFLNIAR